MLRRRYKALRICALTWLLSVPLHAFTLQSVATEYRQIAYAAERSYGFDDWRSTHAEKGGLVDGIAATNEDLVLTSLQRNVLRMKHTEPLNWYKSAEGLDSQLVRDYGTAYPQIGAYCCVGCGTPLFRASTKMECSCGWPAFWDCIDGAVLEQPDVLRDGFVPRAKDTEIVCATCKGHLGHVFRGEGWKTPTDVRHCVNGAILAYQPHAALAGEPGPA